MSEPATPPEDLEERTLEFALAMIRFTSRVPKTEESRVLTRQAVRAGTSIGANYAEARRARSRAEFAAKTGDCLKEAEETRYWLRLLDRSSLADSKKCEPLLAEIRELIAIFTTINKRSKSP